MLKTKGRRASTAVALAAISTIALSACSGATSAEEDTKTAASMYTWISNENDRAQWTAFIDAAAKSDPGFSLTLEGPSFADYWTKVKTRLASSGAPCIITTQAARTQELKDLLAPLSDLAKANNVDLKQYNAAMMDGMTVDGTVRAIPYDAEPFVLYYNKDMFKAAGLDLPTDSYTRDQFLADAEALTTGGKFGLAVQPQFGAGPGMSLAFADGNVPVKAGKLELGNSGFADGIQFSFDLVNKYGVAKSPQASDTTDVAQQEFLSGQAAMVFDGPWMYEALTTGTKGEVGIAVIPSTKGKTTAMIQGSGFGIATTCQDKDAAFKNIMKITTPEVIGAVGASRGTVPSISSEVSSWAGTKPTEDVKAIETMLENGLPLETTSTWNQVETLFAQYSTEGFRGQKTAAEILATITQAVK